MWFWNLLGNVLGYSIALAIVGYAISAIVKLGKPIDSKEPEKLSPSFDETLQKILEDGKVLLDTFVVPTKHVELRPTPESEYSAKIIRATDVNNVMLFVADDRYKTIRTPHLEICVVDAAEAAMGNKCDLIVDGAKVMVDLSNGGLLPILLHYPRKDSNEFEIIGRNCPVKILNENCQFYIHVMTFLSEIITNEIQSSTSHKKSSL